MPAKNHLLTKSKYIRGLQCQRAMYYDVYDSRKAFYDRETLAEFKIGREFEATFKATFPTGINLDRLLGRHTDRYPQRTAELLSADGEIVLFEAGFLYNEVLVLPDVLRKNADGTFDIYEVKKSAELKDVFRHDAAVQYYVVSHCISPIRSFNLVNNDGNGGFVITDLTQQCIDEMPTVEANIASFKQTLQASSAPDIRPSDHCHQPYTCPYANHCRQQHFLAWNPC